MVNRIIFRLRLVHVKYIQERKIFSSFWLYYENFSRKYFHVFGKILKMLFSTTTQQENHQNTTTHTTQQQQKNQNHKQILLQKFQTRMRTRSVTGSWVHGATRWCDRRGATHSSWVCNATRWCDWRSVTRGSWVRGATISGSWGGATHWCDSLVVRRSWVFWVRDLSLSLVGASSLGVWIILLELGVWIGAWRALCTSSA